MVICCPRPYIPELLAGVGLDVSREDVAVEKPDYFAMRIVNAKVAAIAEIMPQKMRTRMKRKLHTNRILVANLTAVRINVNIDIISF
jgi:hypothetical protein